MNSAGLLFPSEALAWVQAAVPAAQAAVSAAQAAAPAAGVLFPVAVGLASSATHCAGMCGPIHFFLASRTRPGAVWRYHAGRILGYALLGLLVGSLGGLLEGLSGAGFRRAAGWALAVLYAFFGVQLLGWLPVRFRLETYAGKLFPAKAFGRWAAEGKAASLLFPAGLLASLLPCPSTQAVLLFGLGLGKPLLAAGAMAAMGVSTLPFFALIPRRLPAARPGLRLARHYGTALGILFIGLSAWRVYGAAFAGTPACH